MPIDLLLVLTSLSVVGVLVLLYSHYTLLFFPNTTWNLRLPVVPSPPALSFPIIFFCQVQNYFLTFKAILLVRSLPNAIARQPTPLTIEQDTFIPDMDLSTDDAIFNFVDSNSQLCKASDGKLWRGPKQKSDLLLKFFIHGISPLNGIVADLTTSTGK